MKRICVFAGSNSGADPIYRETAKKLGKEIADHGIELVYGGSSKGLMGCVANAVLERNGCAIGVMPTGLFQVETVHTKLTQLHEVRNMHERKATMHNLSDGFVALPGGFGTLEEVFEAVSWGQIGIHNKPIGLLNANGYYQPLIDMVANGVKDGFIREENAKLIMIESDPAVLLEKLIDRFDS